MDESTGRTIPDNCVDITKHGDFHYRRFDPQTGVTYRTIRPISFWDEFASKVWVTRHDCPLPSEPVWKVEPI